MNLYELYIDNKQMEIEITMDDRADLDKKINETIELDDEKKYYFNGFAVTISPPDIMIGLQQAGKTILALNASHSVAKTLVIKLGGILTEFEKMSGTKILTLDEIKEKLKESDATPETGN